MFDDSDDDHPAKRFLKEQQQQQQKQLQAKQPKKGAGNGKKASAGAGAGASSAAGRGVSKPSPLVYDAFGEPLAMPASSSAAKSRKRSSDDDDDDDDDFGGDDDDYDDKDDDDDDNGESGAGGGSLHADKKPRMDDDRKPRILGPNGKPLQPYEIPKPVDTSMIGRQVWLVKVPEYFIQGLEKLDDNTPIGSVQIPLGNISKNQAQMPVRINLDMSDENGFFLPHKYDLQPQTSNAAATSVFSESEEGNLAFEGTSVQRCDLVPQLNEEYSRYMAEKRQKASAPKLQTVHVAPLKNEFKPISEYADDKELRQARKEQDRRERMDKEELKNQLSTIFEKYEYASLDKLQQVTNQPVSWLKEVLSELCDYNTKGAHKNTYQLKPEYAHMGRTGSL